MSSDEDVDNDIKIATGLKERKRHWYTFGIKIQHYYSLKEQLDAIERLGDYANPRVLSFLERINESWVEYGSDNTRDLRPAMSGPYYSNTKGNLYALLDPAESIIPILRGKHMRAREKAIHIMSTSLRKLGGEPKRNEN